jgi:hypothetical protein
LGGTKPFGFLYGAAQTSHTAGTLGEIWNANLFKIINYKLFDKIKRICEPVPNPLKGIEKARETW